MMCSNNIYKYQLLDILKNGKIRTVYKAKDLNNKCLAILKISVDQPVEKLTHLYNEVLTIRRLKHRNINTIVSCFLYKQYVYLTYNFMCFGDCETMLKNVYISGFPEVVIALILKDVLSALTYIHSEHYVHGAIRAKYILISPKKAVISNFSYCQSFISQGEKKPFIYGSTVGIEKALYWTAPEVLYQNLSGYTEKIDIYSIGITCCEMANGFQPFKDTELTYMYIEKVRGSLHLLLDKNSLLENQGSLSTDHTIKRIARDVIVNKSFSEDFHQFVEICLNKNPFSRWAASKLMTHSFLKQCRNTSLSDQLKGQEISHIKKKEHEIFCDAQDTHNPKPNDTKWIF
ncbi:putative serine/threonine-protein kinase STE20-like [Drosophila teissieri]|uniref:putative serine/threonine-protein kinase STE20-like n=1 Tax=Drosophila teissieri TaxID=7243 RepID=UPI001CBA2FB1|nr:putative serine/threonine-protein kinase STE20-like [Drosophila teissieri]